MALTAAENSEDSDVEARAGEDGDEVGAAGATPVFYLSP
jgi:hypothetical protein